MNIVITGITGLRNRGVEAMLRPTLQHLHSRAPGSRVTVLTRSPDFDSERLGRGGTLTQGTTEFARDPFPLDRHPANSSGPAERLRARASAALGLDKKQAPMGSVIAGADAVIALGGDIFSSDYDFHPHIQPLEYAIDQGVPVIMLAHSIGPFVNEDEARMWTRVAQRADLITTREHRSYRYVTETLGIRGPRVAHTADVSFLLDPDPKASAGLSRLYGLDQAAPRIALAPNAQMPSFGDIEARRHREVWGHLITTFLRNTNAEILLLPHVQETGSKYDDRQFATKLAGSLGYPERVRLVAGDHSAAEFKALIGTCSLTVGERMHAVLAALSGGRCAVPVAYSVKAHGIAEDLFGESTASELVIETRDCASSSFVERVMDAWRRRLEIEDILRHSLPRARARAKGNLELLGSVLSERASLQRVVPRAGNRGSAAPPTPHSPTKRSFSSHPDPLVLRETSGGRASPR